MSIFSIWYLDQYFFTDLQVADYLIVSRYLVSLFMSAYLHNV